MHHGSPMFEQATSPRSLCGFLVVSAVFKVLFGLDLAAVIQRRGLRDGAFLERGIFGIDHVVLAALLRERGMVMVLMMVLVLRLQGGIDMRGR